MNQNLGASLNQGYSVGATNNGGIPSSGQQINILQQAGVTNQQGGIVYQIINAQGQVQSIINPQTLQQVQTVQQTGSSQGAVNQPVSGQQSYPFVQQPLLSYGVPQFIQQSGQQQQQQQQINQQQLLLKQQQSYSTPTQPYTINQSSVNSNLNQQQAVNTNNTVSPQAVVQSLNSSPQPLNSSPQAVAINSIPQHILSQLNQSNQSYQFIQNGGSIIAVPQQQILPTNQQQQQFQQHSPQQFIQTPGQKVVSEKKSPIKNSKSPVKKVNNKKKNKKSTDIIPVISEPSGNKTVDQLIGDCINKMTTKLSRPMSEKKDLKMIGLPDHLRKGLDIIFIGLYPSFKSAESGSYFDGNDDHFWEAMRISGIVGENTTAVDDYRLVKSGLGFTHLISKPAPNQHQFNKHECDEGRTELKNKLSMYAPSLAVFYGSDAYDLYKGNKRKFSYGLQRKEDAWMNTGPSEWVLPSLQGDNRTTCLSNHKISVFHGLKLYYDYLNGEITRPQDSDLIFPDQELAKRRSGIREEFVLKKSVNQSPDPTKSSQLTSSSPRFESPNQGRNLNLDIDSPARLSGQDGPASLSGQDGPAHLDPNGPACLDSDGPACLDSEGPACLEPQQLQVSPENTKLCIDTSSSSDDDLEMPVLVAEVPFPSSVRRRKSSVAFESSTPVSTAPSLTTAADSHRSEVSSLSNPRSAVPSLSNPRSAVPSLSNPRSAAPSLTKAAGSPKSAAKQSHSKPNESQSTQYCEMKPNFDSPSPPRLKIIDCDEYVSNDDDDEDRSDSPPCLRISDSDQIVLSENPVSISNKEESLNVNRPRAPFSRANDNSRRDTTSTPEPQCEKPSTSDKHYAKQRHRSADSNSSDDLDFPKKRTPSPLQDPNVRFDQLFETASPKSKPQSPKCLAAASKVSSRGGGKMDGPVSPEKSQGMTSIWGKGEQASFDLPDDYVKDYLKEQQAKKSESGSEDSALPQGLGDIQNPQGLGDIQNPQGLGDIQNPQGLEDIQNAQGLEDIQNPQGLEDIQNPLELEDIQTPQGLEDIPTPSLLAPLSQINTLRKVKSRTGSLDVIPACLPESVGTEIEDILSSGFDQFQSKNRYLNSPLSAGSKNEDRLLLSPASSMASNKSNTKRSSPAVGVRRRGKTRTKVEDNLHPNLLPEDYLDEVIGQYFNADDSSDEDGGGAANREAEGGGSRGRGGRTPPSSTVHKKGVEPSKGRGRGRGRGEKIGVAGKRKGLDGSTDKKTLAGKTKQDRTSAEETEEEIITKSTTASRPFVNKSINQPTSHRGRRRKPVSASAAASKKSSAASSTTEIPSSGYTSSNYNEERTSSPPTGGRARVRPPSSFYCMDFLDEEEMEEEEALYEDVMGEGGMISPDQLKIKTETELEAEYKHILYGGRKRRGAKLGISKKKKKSKSTATSSILDTKRTHDLQDIKKPTILRSAKSPSKLTEIKKTINRFDTKKSSSIQDTKRSNITQDTKRSNSIKDTKRSTELYDTKSATDTKPLIKPIGKKKKKVKRPLRNSAMGTKESRPFTPEVLTEVSSRTRSSFGSSSSGSNNNSPVKDKVPEPEVVSMATWKGKKASKRALDSRETMREKARKPYTSSKIEDVTGKYGKEEELVSCGICDCIDPPVEDIPLDELEQEVEWVGCDCYRWFHKPCTKLMKFTEKFSCRSVKMKCLEAPPAPVIPPKPPKEPVIKKAVVRFQPDYPRLFMKNVFVQIR